MISPFSNRWETESDVQALAPRSKCYITNEAYSNAVLHVFQEQVDSRGGKVFIRSNFKQGTNHLGDTIEVNPTRGRSRSTSELSHHTTEKSTQLGLSSSDTTNLERVHSTTDLDQIQKTYSLTKATITDPGIEVSGALEEHIGFNSYSRITELEANEKMSISSLPGLGRTTSQYIPDEAIRIPENVTPKVQEPTWYYRGRIFKIIDPENRHINNRAMIALAATRHTSIICVAFCEHDDIYDAKRHENFWETHAAVDYSSIGQRGKEVQPILDKLGQRGHPILVLEIDEDRELLPDVFVNLEHPYTIKIGTLKVAPCGRVKDDSVKHLMTAHRNAYNTMLKRGFKGEFKGEGDKVQSPEAISKGKEDDDWK
ncbi:hypothetical protein F5B20DRAFT_82336 [Whalleya microplaca]|nr:hypothetical protein F5B20DRAFT_82336 [Whalleya microplaca]